MRIKNWQGSDTNHTAKPAKNVINSLGFPLVGIGMIRDGAATHEDVVLMQLADCKISTAGDAVSHELDNNHLNTHRLRLLSWLSGQPMRSISPLADHYCFKRKLLARFSTTITNFQSRMFFALILRCPSNGKKLKCFAFRGSTILEFFFITTLDVSPALLSMIDLPGERLLYNHRACALARQGPRMATSRPSSSIAWR